MNCTMKEVLGATLLAAACIQILLVAYMHNTSRQATYLKGPLSKLPEQQVVSGSKDYRILLTDFFFPTARAKWRIEEIYSLSFIFILTFSSTDITWKGKIKLRIPLNMKK